MIDFMLEGYDTVQIGPKLEMPSIEELFELPFLQSARIEDVMKYGGETLKYFMDKMPLTHDRKKVVVNVFMQYLTPELCPIKTADWHIDGKINGDERIHILIGNSSGITTEFQDGGIEIHTEEEGVVEYGYEAMQGFLKRRFLNNSLNDESAIRRIPVDAYATFKNNHLHRIGMPTKPEFRFRILAIESDNIEGFSWDQAMMDRSFVHVGNNGPMVTSIQRRHNQLIIER